MTPDMVLTLFILFFGEILFIFEWLRVDVVGIIMMVLFPLTGLIAPKEAFVGLSSNAVCSIIAVIIIGAGLDKTGVMNQVAGPIIKLAGNSENRIIAMISGTVGIISSMMQNIGAAALFLQAAQRIAKRMEVPVLRILMHMGFCAIIGGTVTLVGASPTILLNDLMVFGGKKLEPFGLFTQTPIGLALLAAAILYFILFGRFVLPAVKGSADRGVTAALMEEYRALGNTYELHIPENYENGQTLENLEIRSRFLVTVVAIGHSKRREKTFTPRSFDTISPGDDIAVMGREENVRRLTEDYGWKLKDGLEVFADSLSRTSAGMAETVVSPRSELIGKTMSEVSFKELYNLNPLALFKGRRIYYSGLTNIPLNMGDTLLLQGPWDRFHLLKNRPQPRALTFATPLEGEILRPRKAKLAICIKPVVFKQVVDDTLKLVKGELPPDVSIKVEGDEGIRAALDSRRFQQVLLNFIINGVQAMEERGGTITIKSFLRGEDQFCFEVRDTGKGIPQKDLSKIFDPFFSTKEGCSTPSKKSDSGAYEGLVKQEGTGLGLAICHGIVKKHGGTIDVKSKEGEGTVFTVCLPIGRLDEYDEYDEYDA